MVELVCGLHHVSSGGDQRKFLCGGASAWAHRRSPIVVKLVHGLHQESPKVMELEIGLHHMSR